MNDTLGINGFGRIAPSGLKSDEDLHPDRLKLLAINDCLMQMSMPISLI